MFAKRTLFASLLLALAGSMLASDRSTVVLTDGLPLFGPLQRAYESGSHAQLNPAMTFVWTDPTAERSEGFWLLTRGEKGASLTQLPLEMKGSEWLGEAVVPSGTGHRLLRVGLDPDSRVLWYEWTEWSSPGVEEAEAMPSLDVTLLDGGDLSPAVLRGNWVVINWWSVSCIPCREEIPQLNRLAREFSGDDVVFLAVAPDEAELIQRFLKKYPFEYLQTRGETDLADVFGNEFPRHLIISPDGVVARTITGGSSNIGKTLKTELAGLLSRRTENKE